MADTQYGFYRDEIEDQCFIGEICIPLERIPISIWSLSWYPVRRVVDMLLKKMGNKLH